jgi:hypothetical protein
MDGDRYREWARERHRVSGRHSPALRMAPSRTTTQPNIYTEREREIIVLLLL